MEGTKTNKLHKSNDYWLITIWCGSVDNIEIRRVVLESIRKKSFSAWIKYAVIVTYLITDGSKLVGRVRGGVFSRDPPFEISFRLPYHCRVFQAELSAIISLFSAIATHRLSRYCSSGSPTPLKWPDGFVPEEKKMRIREVLSGVRRFITSST